jgi:PAS domain S-box-containing protein
MAEGERTAQMGVAERTTPVERASKPIRLGVISGVAGLAFAMFLIFAVDISLPIGFNAAYLYAIAVIGAGLWRKQWIVLATTSLGVFLAIFAFFFKNETHDHIPTSLVLYNRIGSIVVITLTAMMVSVFIARGEKLMALAQELAEAAEDREASAQLVTAVKRIADIGMWSYDYSNPEVVDWSDEVAEIHGYPPGHKPSPQESLAGYDESDRDRIGTAIRDAASSGEPFMEEARMSLADGTRKVVLVMGKVMADAEGNPTRVNGVVQDVTLWRDAESALSAQRRRYAQLVRAMPFIIWTANANGEVDFVNEAMERYSGRSAEDLVGDGWASGVHEDDIERVWQQWAEAMESGGNYDTEFRIRSAEGEYRWHRVSAQPESGVDGTVIRWWGCAIDVHALFALRERADEVARERDMILESITDGVYTLDKEWRFRYLNPAAEVLVNRTSEELVGKVVWDEFPQEVAMPLYEIFHRAMENRTVEYFTNDSPSLERQFDIIVSPSENGLTVFFRDMTEIRRLNEQLAHAQRLESVGRLTGGIAHDFNNLLTVVIGGAEAIQGDPALSEESREMAGLVLEASQRGAELTHRLLAFARRQPLEPKSVDVTAQLMSVLPIIKRTIGEAVAVHTVFQRDLPLVTIDAGQLENALLNLAINARDAMPGGGTLTLEAETVVLGSTYATNHGEVAPGRYVVIAVTDTGTGIEPEVLPRLFDPFFTTKGLGEGSGLGLPMVWGFAKQSGGHVSVYSEVGEGTTFKLYLPLAGDAASVEEDDAPQPHGPQVTSGIILLAEDDHLVQRFAADHLRAHGFEVIAASSGPEALVELEKLEHIDLLFTDVIMPGGMSGRDLAEAVLELRPETPVLYSSGYTENVIIHNGRLDAGVSLLQKPYSGAQLIARVTEVMSAAQEVAT